MATTDVTPVQASALLSSLHDFQKTFNENQRVKKLIKNWNRFLKAESTDTAEIFTVTIQDLAANEIQPGCAIPEDSEDLVTLQASEEALVRIFTGKYNPAHALIDGA
ncbi:MAG TPA: hypothetical protein VG759_09015, partial [Candidatus Angelobacter sp.]|nr:hypothetical protein [Candidatus Angelobacter sp.]